MFTTIANSSTITLQSNQSNPFIKAVLADNPWTNELSVYGHVLQQGKGFVIRYSSDHISEIYATALEAAEAIISRVSHSPALFQYLQAMDGAYYFGMDIERGLELTGLVPVLLPASEQS